MRAFYALGDGRAPFLVSGAAILLNAALDWLFTRQMGFGAPGLVLATAFVNFASAAAMLGMLSARLGGLELRQSGRSLVTLVAAAAAAAAANWGSMRATLPAFQVGLSVCRMKADGRLTAGW